MFRAFALISAVSIILGLGAADPSVPGEAKGKEQKVGRNFEVRIKDFKFDQKKIAVSVGDTVTWINEDDDKHSVTPDAGTTVTFSEIVVPGQMFSKRTTFDKEGILNYKCKFHNMPSMTGSVTVTK